MKTLDPETERLMSHPEALAALWNAVETGQPQTVIIHGRTYEFTRHTECPDCKKETK